MAQDIFGRIVSIDENVSAIKAQLLQSVGAKTANTGSADDKPVEKLIKQIDTITGYKLDEELKKFKNSLEDIRKIYDDIAAKKAQRRNASAASGMTSASESLQKSLAKVIKQTEASLVDFSTKITEALEKATKQVAKGAGIAPIPGAPGAKSKRSTKDLCKCICDCIRRSDKDRIRGRGKGGDGGDGIGGGKGTGGKGPPPMSEDYARRLNEWLNKKPEKPDYRQWGLNVAGSVQKAIESKNPVGEALSNMASFIAKGTGAIIEKTFTWIGKGLGQISAAGFQLGFLGPMGEAMGQFFGGMTEGFLNLVLHPLAEEIDYFNKTNRAEFVTKGGGSIGVEGDVRLGALPKNGGIEWGEIAKSIANYNAELDGGKKRLDIWRVGFEDVLETMTSAKEIQAAQFKNYKRGISEQTKLVRVTRIGLAASHQIMADAGETADLFGDWSQKLGMSNVQIGQMSRVLNGVAKSTGIFGNELLTIAKTTTGILEKMRLMGTMSISSARNIMQLMASAQKSGNSQGMTAFLDVLSKPGLMANSPLSMLSRVLTGGNQDLANKILGGTITRDKSGMKTLADNAERLIKQFAGGRAGMTAQQSLEALSPEMRGMLNEQFLAQFGVTLDGLLLNIKDIRSATKSFNESLTDLNKKAVGALKDEEIQEKLKEAGVEWTNKYNEQLHKANGDVATAMQELLKDKNLPGKLKKAFVGQIAMQQAKSQIDHKFIDQGNDFIAGISDMISKGRNLDQAFGQVIGGGEGQDNREYLRAIGAGDMESGEALKKVLQDQNNRFIAQSKALGVKTTAEMQIGDQEITDAIASAKAGSKEGLEAIVQKLQSNQTLIQNAQELSQNPVLRIEKLLQSIDAALRGKIQDGITELAPMLQGALNNLMKQPFMQSLAKGNYTDAIKEFGAFLKTLPKETSESFAQVVGLGDLSSDMHKALSGFANGFTEVMKPVLFALGVFFEDVVANALKSIKKFLDENVKDWGKIGEYIGQIAGAFTLLSGIISVGSPLLLGLAALIGASGLGGLGTVLAGGTIVLGIGAIIKELNHWDKVMQKHIDVFKGQKKDIQEKQIAAASDANIDYMQKLSEAELKEKEKKAIEGKQNLDAQFKQIQSSWTAATAPETKREALLTLNEAKRLQDVAILEVEYARKLQAMEDPDKRAVLKKEFLEKIAHAINQSLPHTTHALIQSSSFADFEQASANQAKWVAAQKAREAEFREKAKHPLDSSSIDEAKKIALTVSEQENKMAVFREATLKKIITKLGDDAMTIGEALQENIKSSDTAVENKIKNIKSEEKLQEAYAKETEFLTKRFKEAATYQEKYDIGKQLAMINNAFDKMRGNIEPSVDFAAQRAKELNAGNTNLDKLVASVRSGTGGMPALSGSGSVGSAYENFKTVPEAKSMFDEASKTLAKRFSDAKTEKEKLVIAEEMARHMNAFEETQRRLADAATKRNSIFTHDTHLEESLEWIWESIEIVNSNSATIIERLDTMIDLQSEMATASAMLPGVDVEEEIKKRQMASGAGTNEIVANTGETAENTRRTAILLGALLNCVRRNGRRTGSPVTIEGENLDESAFFDQFIDCDWVDTTARSPAYTWRQGNIGKKN